MSTFDHAGTEIVGWEPDGAPVTMEPVNVNGRGWNLLMPSYRAEREEWTSGWEVERLDSMHANLQPGDVVYDVGTEEGDLTGLYALWGCQTVLVEPNVRVWPNIKAIWEANGLMHPLAWWVGFASNRTGYEPDLGSRYTPAGQHFGQYGWPECADGPLVRAHGFQSLVEAKLTLPNIRLDELASLVNLRGGPPAAITIDVEGAEMLVLEGCGGLFAAYRPLVWVSVHDEMIKYDYGYTSVSVLQFMALHGYRMHLLAIDHECHFFFWPKERTDSVILP